MRNRGTILAWLVVFGLSVFAVPAIDAEKTKINFVLDWIVGGRHAGWFAALHKGYFADEGLDVTISRGFGSGRGIKRMVAGKADISFNDIATAINEMDQDTPDCDDGGSGGGGGGAMSLTVTVTVSDPVAPSSSVTVTRKSRTSDAATMGATKEAFAILAFVILTAVPLSCCQLKETIVPSPSAPVADKFTVVPSSAL